MSDTATATMTMSRDITGRDGYIIAQALHVAAKALLAEPFPEESNAQDMREILEAVWPGELMQRLVHDRFQDGLRMGLDFPDESLTLNVENVEAWLAAGLADGDPPPVLMASAIVDARQMEDHLKGRTRIVGLSDRVAKSRLAKARATIRVLSGPAPVCPARLEVIRTSIGSDFRSNSVWRDEKLREFPDDLRNAEAVRCLDNLESDIDSLPEDILLRFEAAWKDGELCVAEAWGEKLRQVGFVSSPASAQEFVADFLADVEPRLAEARAYRDAG